MAIDKSAYSKFEAEIATKIKNKPIVRNPERLEGQKQKRDPYIRKDDEIHPFHW